MLLLSSTTTCCSCHAMVSLHAYGGLKSLPLFRKTIRRFDSNVLRSYYNGFGNSTASGFFHSGCNGNSKQFVSLCVAKFIPSNETGLDNFSQSALTRYQLAEFDDSAASSDGIPIDPSRLSDSFKADSLSAAQDYLNSKLESVKLSVETSFGDANRTLDNFMHDIVLFFNKSGVSVGNKFTRLATEFKEASGRAELAALDVRRGTIIFIEGSLEQGGKAVVSSYSLAKQLLPQEFQEALTSSEETVDKVLHPFETSLQQVIVSLQAVGERLGLDLNDPLIHFILVFGLAATLWGAYIVLRYGGYSGDLTPQSSLELLQGNENVVLVDIRSENLRERDGIPDLRRKARFRYASVTPPEVDGSVIKLIKGGREFEDSVLATIIRNLKIADDRSKVLVLDSDGSRSKGVARSLTKLGTKRAYLVQGGFRSWVEEGFRIKMLKPETLLTVLNEETEAIIEEIKPTPLKLAGYVLGILATGYSLVEWEKTLQLIGVIGLGQSIYRRLTSYEDSKDFKQDLRLLLAPVRLGVEAISGAIGRTENGRNGLTTSPRSSSDVQSRVLQAAAKHECQPEDSSSSSENVNVSEA